MKRVIKTIFWCFHDFSFYKFIALLGLVIRVIILPWVMPSIFDVIAEFFIGQLGLPLWAYHVLVRIALLIVDYIGLMTIFYFLSYFSVGNSYDSGAEPVWGSVCYSIYYTVYWVIPIILFNFFEWWVIAVVFSGYLLLSAGIYLMSAFVVDTLPDNWLFRLILHCIVFVIVVVGVCLLKHYLF